MLRSLVKSIHWFWSLMPSRDWGSLSVPGEDANPRISLLEHHSPLVAPHSISLSQSMEGEESESHFWWKLTWGFVPFFPHSLP